MDKAIEVAESLFEELDIKKARKISRYDLEHGLYFLFKY